jgi:hypothetical protein
MGKGKKNTRKNESMMDKQEAGASRKNKKVSSDDDTNTNDAPLNSTCILTADPADEVWDVWDVVRVLHAPSACACRTPECESKAVVVWAVTLDPTDEWPLCQECQERDFGVSPADISPPKRVEFNVHHEDDQTLDSKQADDQEPDEIATEEETEGMVKDTSTTADETCNDNESDPSKVTESNNNTNSNTNDGDETNGDEEEEMDEVWDVCKVMTVADVNDCPIKCSIEKCTLAAACVYVSNLAPTEKYYTCLDCQVSFMRRENNRGMSYPTLLVYSHLLFILMSRFRRMARTLRSSHRFHDAGTKRRFDLQVLTQEGRSHATYCFCGESHQ